MPPSRWASLTIGRGEHACDGATLREKDGDVEIAVVFSCPQVRGPAIETKEQRLGHSSMRVTSDI
jgi:hypothetical protein